MKSTDYLLFPIKMPHVGQVDECAIIYTFSLLTLSWILFSRFPSEVIQFDTRYAYEGIGRAIKGTKGQSEERGGNQRGNERCGGAILYLRGHISARERSRGNTMTK